MLEADDIVGGISRTVERDGWRFDIGGHRFFTKVPEVETLWHEILPDEDFLLRPRLSRIYYDGKFFDYPLRAMERPDRTSASSRRRAASARTCGCASGAPPTPPRSRAGRRRGSAGACTASSSRPTRRRCGACRPASIQADWAAQRIKNLSLGKAIVNSLLPRRNQTEITSLIEEFQYPKLGPGMMWEVCRDKVVAAGTEVRLERRVVARRARRRRGPRGRRPTAPDGEQRLPATAVVSSMPIGELLRAMDPPAPPPCWPRPTRLQLPRLPHRRPRRPRALRLPGQLDLRPRARA